MKLGVLGKELLNPLSLVPGEVVQDYVDFPAPGLQGDQLGEERDDELKGFAVRITPNGSKSFVWEGRVNGRTRRTGWTDFPI